MVKKDISDYQGTLAKTIQFAGVGLHSGKLIQLEVQPAGPGSGIMFSRSDQKDSLPIKADTNNISETKLCTTIGSGKQKIATIEHLMAAFAGLGIDNALVQVSADEIPILDGSSAPFVDKLLEAGIQLQSLKRPVIILDQPLEVTHGDQHVRYEPWPIGSKNCHLEIESVINFDNSQAIGRQRLSLHFSKKTFLEICEARTFCHVNEVELMRSVGLALGGSLDNAVVVNDTGILNNDGLRYKDEFIRHKVLDLIGDLALLGGRLVGKISTYKSGHSLHAAFTKEVNKYINDNKDLVPESTFSTAMLMNQHSFS